MSLRLTLTVKFGVKIFYYNNSTVDPSGDSGKSGLSMRMSFVWSRSVFFKWTIHHWQCLALCLTLPVIWACYVHCHLGLTIGSRSSFNISLNHGLSVIFIYCKEDSEGFRSAHNTIRRSLSILLISLLLSCVSVTHGVPLINLNHCSPTLMWCEPTRMSECSGKRRLVCMTSIVHLNLNFFYALS